MLLCNSGEVYVRIQGIQPDVNIGSSTYECIVLNSRRWLQLTSTSLRVCENGDFYLPLWRHRSLSILLLMVSMTTLMSTTSMFSVRMSPLYLHFFLLYFYIWLFLCLFLCLFVCLAAYVYTCLSTFQPALACLFVCLFVSLLAVCLNPPPPLVSIS